MDKLEKGTKIKFEFNYKIVTGIIDEYYNSNIDNDETKKEIFVKVSIDKEYVTFVGSSIIGLPIEVIQLVE